MNKSTIVLLHLLILVFLVLATSRENVWASLKSDDEWRLELDTAEHLNDECGAAMLTRLHQLEDHKYVERVLKEHKQKLHLTHDDEDLAHISELANEASIRNHPEIQFIETRKSGQELQEIDQKTKMLRLMQQAIYETQEDILAIDDILKIDKKSLEYQILSIFNLLEEMVRDLHVILTRLDRIERYQYQNNGTVDQWLYLTYYAHAVKKHMDVTYIAESLVEKYRRYREDPLKHRYLKEKNARMAVQRQLFTWLL